jgi:hypothetical protein
MKKTFLLLMFSTLILSCEVEGDLTRDLMPVNVDQQSTIPKLLGTFTSTSGINAKGKVSIFLENNQYKLQLVDFSISSGPDLKVYLSKTNTPSDFVNLGNLNPTMVYSVPQNIEIKDYKFVLIHCQQYNHLFAIAELIKN